MLAALNRNDLRQAEEDGDSWPSWRQSAKLRAHDDQLSQEVPKGRVEEDSTSLCIRLAWVCFLVSSTCFLTALCLMIFLAPISE